MSSMSGSRATNTLLMFPLELKQLAMDSRAHPIRRLYSILVCTLYNAKKLSWHNRSSCTLKKGFHLTVHSTLIEIPSSTFVNGLKREDVSNFNPKKDISIFSPLRKSFVSVPGLGRDVPGSSTRSSWGAHRPHHRRNRDLSDRWRVAVVAQG